MQAVLKDRRRAQHGGVLSGVLIMVAFLAIIAGALMTELSTNFLLSRALLNRAANEATVGSAVELSLDRLQTAPLVNGCPSLSPITLNGITVVTSYVTCAPVVDRHSPQFTRVAASSSPFNVDGAHAVIATAGQNLYLVGDAGGNVYQYRFGASQPNWSEQLPGSVTGQPLMMADVGGNSQNDMSNLIPLSITNNQPQGCDEGYCVANLLQDVGSAPDATCYMAAKALVTSSPAAGVMVPDVVYFGDQSGTLFAYSATQAGNCALQVSDSSNSLSVVAGPLVFPGPSGKDEIFVIASNATSSRLIRYEYTQSNSGAPDIDIKASIALPAASATGIAVERTTLPARIAITFAGGQIALARIDSTFAMSLTASRAISTAIDAAPYWCQCPGPADVGVAGRNGALYLFDSGLGLQATYPAGGPAISTTPGSDGVGDWFFGANDGYVYEVQQPAGQSTMTSAARYGPFGGQIASSVQVANCGAWICIYLGTQNGGLYLVPLDARDAVMSACVSTAPPACSGVNPRLWAKVEVGSSGSQRTVSVQGWSYYSP